jgi:hypothetical protein
MVSMGHAYSVKLGADDEEDVERNFSFGVGKNILGNQLGRRVTNTTQ